MPRGRTAVPPFFLDAENDYSTNSGKMLDAELGNLATSIDSRSIRQSVGLLTKGMTFPLNSAATWAVDVFALLGSYMRK
jgi:hypothetical protein